MNKLKRPVFTSLTAGLLCAAGTAAYFSDFEKDKFCCGGYVTTEIEEKFSGSYTYAGEWSVLQKRDPDQEISGSVKGSGRLLAGMSLSCTSTAISAEA